MFVSACTYLFTCYISSVCVCDYMCVCVCVCVCVFLFVFTQNTCFCNVKDSRKGNDTNHVALLLCVVQEDSSAEGSHCFRHSGISFV